MIKTNTSLVLIKKFYNSIINENIIFLNQNILIAFSGGQDSMCLTILILQLIRQFNCNFGLIYCNHFWTSNILYNISNLLKISFILKKNISFSLTPNKNFTEKKASLWRYSIFYRVSQFYNYKLILTGQTVTDQVENLLLKLFRGSSKKNLCNILIDQLYINKSITKIFLSINDLNSKIIF